MQQTIWKTVLSPTHVQEIRVPAGAEMLCAREQHNEIALWYRCDPEAPEEVRVIAVVGTGDLVPPASEGRYLGTAALDDGRLMCHVFERTAF